MNRNLQRIMLAVMVSLLTVSSLGGGSGVKASQSFEEAAPGAVQAEQPLAVANSNENVGLLGHLGGTANTIEVQGQYAYVGFGPEFAVLDVSDPAHIQRVGWLLAKASISDISLNGNYAYVAYGGGAAGLQVVDIHVPTTPILLTILEFDYCGDPSNISTSGSKAYFAYSSCMQLPMGRQMGPTYLHSLDISNPADPIIIDTESPGYGWFTEISTQNGWLYGLWNDYTYDTSLGSYLKVFDVSSPDNLAEAATYFLGDGYSRDIALSGDNAFIAAGSHGLKIMDISDPTQPTAVITHTLPGSAIGIVLDGSIAYVPLDTPEIIILDLIDLLNPAYIGAYQTNGPAYDLFINGTTAYSANGWGGVEIFNITNLTQSGLLQYPQNPNDMTYAEPHVFMAAEDGFWVLDISNPRFPVPVAHLMTEHPVVSLVQVGNYAIIALPGEGLWAVDISNPRSPSLSEFYSLPKDIQQMIFDSNRIYVAAGADGLYILDASNMPALVELGAYLPPDTINAVAASGNYAYLASDNGMPVIDVSDLGDIEEVGRFDPPDEYPYCQNTDTVAVKGDIVFHGSTCKAGYNPLAGIHGYVRLIDVSDPDDPFEAGVLPDVGTPIWISLEYNRAYVTSLYDGLRLFNISDLSSPFLIGSYSPPEIAYKATPAGEYIFLYQNSTIILQYPGDPNRVYLPIMSDNK